MEAPNLLILSASLSASVLVIVLAIDTTVSALHLIVSFLVAFYNLTWEQQILHSLLYFLLAKVAFAAFTEHHQHVFMSHFGSAFWLFQFGCLEKQQGALR